MPIESDRYSFADIASTTDPLIDTPDAQVFVHKGALLFNIKTKGNKITGGVLDVIDEAIDVVAAYPDKYKGIIFGNGGKNFAVGADLDVFLEDGKNKKWDNSNAFIARGQEVLWKLQHAPFPKIFMGKGLALGGGAELAMHCDTGVVTPDFRIGLVENKVGLIPGWGGTEELLFNLVERQLAKQQETGEGSIIDAFVHTFDYLAENTLKAAEDAKQAGFIPKDTQVLQDENALLPAAVEQINTMANHYQAPDASRHIYIPVGVKATLEKRLHAKTGLNSHQQQVLEADIALLGSMEGKQVTATQLYTKARELFGTLVSHPAACACIEHTKATGNALPTESYPPGSLENRKIG